MQIKKTTLKDQAHDYIRNAIVSNEMVMNRVYSIPELASMLNTSRTPVREAVLQLELEGYVEILPNKGMRIKAFDKQTIHDIYQMRMAIEGFCCAYLAEHIQEPEAQRILMFLTMLLEENRGSKVNYTSNDQLFHQKIIDFSGNRRFIETLMNMRLYTSEFFERLMRWDNANAEHQQILEAIASGDPDAARKASDTHVLNTYHDIIDSGKFDIES